MSDHSDTIILPETSASFVSNRKLWPAHPKRCAPGYYKARREDLQPGVVTRREWLRFLTHVDLGPLCYCTPESPHHHWLWNGAIQRLGYGHLKWRGCAFQAHRFACVALGIAIPEDHEPDHLCPFRHCVNPACIDIVSHQVNVLRSNGPAALNARKEYCKAGHLLEGSNLLPHFLKLGKRQCRLCKNRHMHEYNRRKSEKAHHE